MLCVVNLCCCFFLFFVRNFSEGFFFCSSVMCMLCVWFCRCCLAFSERALHTRFFCCWLSVSLLPMTMCYVGQNEKCGTTEKKYTESQRDEEGMKRGSIHIPKRAHAHCTHNNCVKYLNANVQIQLHFVPFSLSLSLSLPKYTEICALMSI